MPKAALVRVFLDEHALMACYRPRRLDRGVTR